MARNILIITSRIITNVPLMCRNKQVLNLNKSSVFVINHYKNIFRKFSNTNSAIDDSYKEVHISSLSEYKAKHCPGIKFVTPILRHLFNLSTNEAKDLIKKYPKLKYFNPGILEENFNICTNVGVSPELLLQYPLLLTTEYVNYKIEYLQELDVDINLIAPIMFANIKTLNQMTEIAKMERRSCPYGNRIIYLSYLLNLPAPEIAEKIVDHIYVLRMSLKRLESNLKTLLDYGIEPRNILNDCWALRYSPQIAEERLRRANEANVLKVKTWMIRCTDKVFERCINRQIENRKILGSNSTVEEYLSKRLECSLENAKFLTKKYPALMKMNILKMKKTLDYLYEQGYTPIHVCRVPRIMVHSQETTKQRFQQLKQLGYVPPSLAILCKSKRDFDKLFKILLKRKKNSDMKQQTQESQH